MTPPEFERAANAGEATIDVHRVARVMATNVKTVRDIQPIAGAKLIDSQDFIIDCRSENVGVKSRRQSGAFCLRQPEIKQPTPFKAVYQQLSLSSNVTIITITLPSTTFQTTKNSKGLQSMHILCHK